MVKELDKRAIDWTLVKPGAAGQVRPDVKQDEGRRQTDTALRGQQARAGEIPMKGEAAASQVHRPHAPVTHSVPTQDAPKPSAAEGQVRSESRHHETPATSPRTTTSSDAAAMNQLVEAGKKALKDLNQLAQGGQGVAKTILPAAATPQTALRNALITQFTLASKKSAQPGKEAAKSPEKELPVALAKDDGKVRQPSDRIGAEKVAEAVAQKNPFAADGRVARAEKREAKDDIKTDRRAAERLGSVTDGVARGIVAASGSQEFSGGSYSGGFGDPTTESAGLAGKVGAAPQIPVYGESANYVETHALYLSLGLTKVLYGQEELRERVSVAIGDRIANTRDDVPLSDRMNDAGYLEQAAYGTRFTPYGKGIIG